VDDVTLFPAITAGEIEIHLAFTGPITSKFPLAVALLLGASLPNALVRGSVARRADFPLLYWLRRFLNDCSILMITDYK
jgi:hypothetical protein